MTVCVATSDFIHSTALLGRAGGYHDGLFDPTCRHRTEGGLTMLVVPMPMPIGTTGAVTYVTCTGGLMAHGPVSDVERLRTELERLRDGWCGPNSLAPSRGTLRDFDTLFDALGSGYEVPEIEVDEETGYLTLRWHSEDGQAGLSMILKGDRQALVIASKFGGEPIASSSVFSLAKAESLARHVTLNDDLDELLYA